MAVRLGFANLYLITLFTMFVFSRLNFSVHQISILNFKDSGYILTFATVHQIDSWSAVRKMTSKLSVTFSACVILSPNLSGLVDDSQTRATRTK